MAESVSVVQYIRLKCELETLDEKIKGHDGLLKAERHELRAQLIAKLNQAQVTKGLLVTAPERSYQLSRTTNRSRRAVTLDALYEAWGLAQISLKRAGTLDAEATKFGEVFFAHIKEVTTVVSPGIKMLVLETGETLQPPLPSTRDVGVIELCKRLFDVEQQLRTWKAGSELVASRSQLQKRVDAIEPAVHSRLAASRTGSYPSQALVDEHGRNKRVGCQRCQKKVLAKPTIPFRELKRMVDETVNSLQVVGDATELCDSLHAAITKYRTEHATQRDFVRLRRAQPKQHFKN